MRVLLTNWRVEVYAVVEATQEVHVTLVIMVTVPLSQETGVSHIAAAVVNPEQVLQTCPYMFSYWPLQIPEPVFIMVARPAAGRLFYLTKS